MQAYYLIILDGLTDTCLVVITKASYTASLRYPSKMDEISVVHLGKAPPPKLKDIAAVTSGVYLVINLGPHKVVQAQGHSLCAGSARVH